MTYYFIIQLIANVLQILLFLSIDLSSATFNVTELPFECRLYVFPTFSPLFFFVLTDIWIMHASYRSSYAPLENRLYFYPSSQVEFVSQFSTDSTNNFSGSFFCASFRMSFHFSSKSTDTGNDAGVFFWVSNPMEQYHVVNF